MRIRRFARLPRVRNLRAAVLATVAALGLSACATMDQDDLSGYVEQLHSDAALGHLVAGQAAQRRAPYIFVWLQSAELLHHVEQLHDKFTGEIPNDGLKAKVDQAKALADEIGTALGDLHDHSKSGSVAGDVAATLGAQAKRTESLYEELQ